MADTAQTSPSEQKPPTPGTDPVKPLPEPPWWHRHLPPEDRRRIMSDLAMNKPDHWAFRFTVMLTMAVVVAVMGLSLNSAAVVIGAMLLAPLMQPVLASGATLSMALFSRSILSLGKVFLATVWCIAVSYVLWRLIPDQDLTPEILARTTPNINDLVVALAAGTAGAYATVREDASSSLPGVAVAVALVPPLATVGISLAADDKTDQAIGALLLYTTNLAAIIFASILVFIATGFVPPRRLASNLTRLLVASLILSIVVTIIAVPLYRASVKTININTTEKEVKVIVEDWLQSSDLRPADFDPSIDFDDDAEPERITISLRGFTRPPDSSTLEPLIHERFPDTDILVEYVRIEQATTTTTAPPVTLAEDEQLRLARQAQAFVIVEEWLQQSGLRYRLDEETGVTLEGTTLNIDAAGNGDPPPIDELGNRLNERLDIAVVPSLTWTERAVINLGDNAPTPLEEKQTRMLVVVEEWANARNLQLRSFEYNGSWAEIEVAGNSEPSFTQLERSLREIAEEDVPVQVYFTQRQLITTTIPPEFPLNNP